MVNHLYFSFDREIQLTTGQRYRVSVFITHSQEDHPSSREDDFRESISLLLRSLHA